MGKRGESVLTAHAASVGFVLASGPVSDFQGHKTVYFPFLQTDEGLTGWGRRGAEARAGTAHDGRRHCALTVNGTVRPVFTLQG